MQLKYIRIKNFRSIEDININLYDFTSLIGPNNCGKSTIIRAIEIFLNQVKPSIDEWKKGCEDQEIVIEGLFEHLEDWERNTPGVAGLVNDGKIKLRVRAKINPDGKAETSYEAFIKQYEIQGWSERWPDLSSEIKDIAEELGINNGTQWRTKANRTKVEEKVTQERTDLAILMGEDWTSENISIAPALKQALPNAVVIPAVKDAADEIKTSNTTIFGALLGQIILPAIQGMDEYKNLIESVETLSKTLSGEAGEEVPIIKELTQEITTRMSSIIESKVKITMSTPDTNKFVGSNTTLLMDDGTETTIGRQGHGSQRSLVFALIEVLANRVSNSDQNVKSTILLFEEPELYLHPHLMGRLKNALKSISNKESWQVVISTHSPFLIDVVDNPQSLVILNRNSSAESPFRNQLRVDPFIESGTAREEKNALRASLDFHPTVNQAFFAKRVILVEGDTELALFNHALKLHEYFDVSEEVYNNTTIVSCGGKWTIVPYAKLLCAFGIPFRIVHDCDRKDRSDDELEGCHAIDPFKANEKIRVSANGNQIFLVEDTLEHLLWEQGVVVPAKDKPFSTWKRVNELLAEESKLENFPRLRDLFNFVYNW
ncbi:ATP-dependent endonuclease [Rossellomorea oryzaecorticis]|uniref:ATP-dependent endonuclease n=1 Tax=Rossellomorea oryzaecorticis TaxID=1396505 RepID=A0ABU9K4Y5_9BACI